MPSTNTDNRSFASSQTSNSSHSLAPTSTSSSPPVIHHKMSSGKLKSYVYRKKTKETDHRTPTKNNSAKRHLYEHTSEKKYKCDQTSAKKYKHANTSDKKYKSGHTSEKKNKCDHTSDKRYQCDHSNEKRYKCDLCSYQVARRSQLATHFNKVHVDVKADTNRCVICDELCADSEAFFEHMVDHAASERKNFYRCFLRGCSYFSHQHTFKHHLLTCHDDLNKYNKFDFKNSLFPSSLLYLCDLCDFKCNRNSTLMVHRRYKHSSSSPQSNAFPVSTGRTKDSDVEVPKLCIKLEME